MATISILANKFRPSGNRRSDDTIFGMGTLSWQDPVHSWKAGPGEVMTVEKQDFAAENPSNAGSDMRRRPVLVGKLSREINLQTAAKPALST